MTPPERTARVCLGMDVGGARIGLALSRSGWLVETLPTLHRRGRKQDFDALEKLILAERITDVVLGLPLLPSGEEGEQSEKTREFSRSLARRFPGVRLHFQDERYSSAEAREIGSATASHSDEDRIAAAVILQEFLVRMKDEG